MKNFKLIAIAAIALFLSVGTQISARTGGNPTGTAASILDEGTLCETVQAFAKMAPTNFKEILGDLDDYQTEMEEEDVFSTTVVLPSFDHGYIFPTFTDGKKKAVFHQMTDSKSASEAALLEVVAELKGCLPAAGYKASVDSGIHFFKSATVSIEVMTKVDMDEEGEDIFFVLLQVYKK